jgi:hypothetical protein
VTSTLLAENLVFGYLLRGDFDAPTRAVSRLRDLNRSATNIPSACRIANIALNDAMILPYGANLGRMEFSERTGTAS